MENLREAALRARENGSPRFSFEYIGLFYQLYQVDGTWEQMEIDNDKLDVRVTPFVDFLNDHPEL